MMHTRSQVCALATVLLAVSACTVSSEDQPSPIDGFAGAGGQGASAGAAGAGGQGATAGAAGAGGSAGAWKGLLWPIDCTLGSDCEVTFPDTDGDGKAFDCGAPGYTGHQGTDISVTWDKMDQGTAVYAAESGVVQWVFDGHFDRCPSSTEPSCQAPTLDMGPNVESGYMVCTDGSDAYCVGTKYTTNCFFCFYGSNVVVIRHPGNAKVFATRYDHLRRDSIVVKPGQTVARGDKIAEVGSAGNSTGPHLHFEVWAGGFYVLADPWAGPCGPNQGPTLWENQLTTP
ncbi:MAG: M23 family metallopeptidase [Deltaproteobacteria bacterium]|nr:M23 family metallopeptidase [Deltaproteobacteria bacterium]